MSADNPWLGRRVLNYAHRGGAKEAPENTLAAFEHSVRVGAHGLELEVRASADRELVVFHDDRVDRVTAATGRVDRLTADELCRLAVLGPAVGVGGSVAVPTLRAVLERFPATFVNIDIKATVPRTAPYERLLAEILRAFGRTDDVIVASFHQAALDAFRSVAPHVTTSASPQEVAALWSDAWGPPATGRVVAVQVPTTFQDLEVVTGPFVERAHRHGLAVHVWTIDDEAEMGRLLDLGVDGIVTDRPTLLARVLRERGIGYSASGPSA
ncbi:MAG TPA: glycerophosphodiester phosphodiesterase [Nitriliruptorales bacterium]|nr:glycerophosphodiester phosphodiesterase [Nitriliruptorales bacterium]